MTAPTIGRCVWFYGYSSDGVIAAGAPFTATITYVWSPMCVNVQYLDHYGNPHTATSVTFRELRSDDRHGHSNAAGWPLREP